ncbi:MAG: dTMP kinase [Elusimicrobia bacterium RIFCSPHIGHO2_02_FULL_57_9]|nr:MAG: dTMP kinase [Elusimicrobia bacterium RIFCSPHIGHO2_02_FULL_57_9]
MSPHRGVFIVLEGPDKSGKSTQAALLVRYLKSHKIPFLHSREPGGTAFAEAIRKLLLDPRHQVTPLAELLLYEAARAQHTQETLLPALRRGKFVLCERYTLATMAYQGHARGLSLPLVRRLNQIATSGLKPDLTIVLDVLESEFNSRDKQRRHDRLELESPGFRRRVREGYRSLARRQPRVALLNGRRDVAQLHQEILQRVCRFLS